jgi:hypothetical protein
VKVPAQSDGVIHKKDKNMGEMEITLVFMGK